MKKGLIVVACAFGLVLVAGAASAQGVFYVQNNRTGVHVAAPTAPLDVFAPPGSEGTGNAVVKLSRAGALAFQLQDTNSGGAFWNFANANNSQEFRISKSGTGGVEFTVDSTGNVKARGNFFANGVQLNVPDFVFADGYELMPLSEVAAFIQQQSHLPGIPSADEINSGLLNMTDMQMKLLQKIEELTLYTLQQQNTIDELQAKIATLE